MSYPYSGLRVCEECGARSAQTDMVYIPEEGGSYVLCQDCMKAIDDGFEEMQRVIQDSVQEEK